MNRIDFFGFIESVFFIENQYRIIKCCLIALSSILDVTRIISAEKDQLSCPDVWSVTDRFSGKEQEYEKVFVSTSVHCA